MAAGRGTALEIALRYAHRFLDIMRRGGFSPPSFFLVPLAAVLVLCCVFLARAPVLLVVDESFVALYGRDRAFVREAAASLSLFRRVKRVTVASGAGQELAAIAAGAAAKAPRAVVFPYRYWQAAASYGESRPAAAVRVLGGRVRKAPALPSGAAFVRTDAARDLRRAGREAARRAGSGRVLVAGDGWLGEEEREAFRAGLREKGFDREPQFSAGGGVPPGDFACAVVAGPAEPFFEQNLEIPVILFSWIHPAWTPTGVAVVFDDSPWALLAGAARLPPGKEAALSSKMRVLGKNSRRFSQIFPQGVDKK
jgi:hypothetical protein